MAERNLLVDVHSHLYLPWYLDLLRGREVVPRVADHPTGDRFVIFADEEDHDPPGRSLGRDHYDLDDKLTFMAANGIDQSVLSLGNPWLDPFDGAHSLDIARRVNADFAGMSTTTGGRLVGLGVLPSSTVDDAHRVVGEVADTPGLVGIVSGLRICGRPLDDPSLEPVWDALARTGVPLLLHPSDALGAGDLEGYGHALPIAFGFPFETTVGVARMALAGVLTRYPELKVIASHGGGTLPFLANRLDAVWRSSSEARARLPDEPPSVALSRIFVDTIVYGDGPLAATGAMVADDHLMFGTDHPFSVSDPAVNQAVLRDGLSERDHLRAAETTARALFGLPTLRDHITV